MGKLGELEHLTAGPGWAAFADPHQYLSAALVLMAATASGALLAHHPVYRGRAVTLGMLEQRKTLILYSTVGALIAIVCTVAPSMAFVIFGIGGLMRFRTDTGESTTTGHTIMGTLIGLCWGLGMQLVAVLATLYCWAIIYVLEAAPIHKITIGIDVALMARAAEAYRDALQRAGCRILGHGKSVKKAHMHFVIRLPAGRDSEAVWKALATIPDDLRGATDWPD
jgi:hypothetical protein